MQAYFSGLFLGLSLIVAIGSQNAFVMKQGIRHQYVFLVCTLCAVSDAILITLGVSGFGIFVEKYPQIETLARYGGALFLTTYGVLSLKSAFTQSHAMGESDLSADSPLKVAMICLAFTWLNPHVYLDTVVLLGSISTRYQGEQFNFGLGAVTASFLFFFSLGYGAKKLAPWFRKPQAWKVLEVIVGVTMLLIAWSLISS
ncbi:LysE/ArgO family amino acid transporter [Vibrio sp. SCSIO 43136]|uniref:LysE/ArgO family amino acid transporter n=1 Tax=Vibrio sp. SCSIO 43136 TaxID=2819101 RepID=UPI00207575C3|nr:LysE/ArgO family amino acid transporter [Vibrio sp. SCSIO 43136]USD64028.1 amino acid transporter [Vibrio sp. SCSIO 43136]